MFDHQTKSAEENHWCFLFHHASSATFDIKQALAARHQFHLDNRNVLGSPIMIEATHNDDLGFQDIKIGFIGYGFAWTPKQRQKRAGIK